MYFRCQGKSFDIHLVKLFASKGSHKIRYCANEREVMDDSLTKHIPDLGKQIHDQIGELFTYQCYVTGKYLDGNVDPERTGFNFPTGDSETDDDQPTDGLTLKDIRKGVVDAVEDLLAPYLKGIRESKLAAIKEHIHYSAPQFKAIIKYKPESIRRIQPNLSANKLNIELFKLQSELELEVKELSEAVLGVTKDVRDTEEYKEMYNDYIEKFNDIGKSNLPVTLYIGRRSLNCWICSWDMMRKVSSRPRKRYIGFSFPLEENRTISATSSRISG